MAAIKLKANEEGVAVAAIQHALKALRKRHLAEEAVHAPAITAISRPLIYQGSEWKDKEERLELELQQCYIAQSRLSEQLATEVAEGRVSNSLIQEKSIAVANLEKQVAQLSDECSELKKLLDEKTKSLELVTSENQELKRQLEETNLKTKNAEAENKMLIDRWMFKKLQDAEHLNEENAHYEYLLGNFEASMPISLQEHACQQADGVVRQSEEGAEYFVESTIPSTCKNRIHAHDGGCAAILFEYNSSKLITGGKDHSIKMWDTSTGTLSRTLHGCLGSILDLTITYDNETIIAASSSNNLYVWDVNSDRIRHTLTGHTDKVCAVDVSKISNRHAVSAAYDRSIKFWDLQRGYCTNTFKFSSNCNAICFSVDGRTICSGHVDGNLRLWDIQSGKHLCEVSAHSLAVTSISLSRNGNTILTSGRDNVHNVFDTRTLEVFRSLRASKNRVAPNLSRSCISADDSYIAAGSADGSVHIWSIQKGNIISTLKEHGSSVLCSAWSGLGKPLATSDKNGVICTWM